MVFQLIFVKDYALFTFMVVSTSKKSFSYDSSPTYAVVDGFTELVWNQGCTYKRLSGSSNW